MVLLHRMVKLVEIVLLNKMVQRLVQPPKLASETTENASTSSSKKYPFSQNDPTG